MSRVAAGEISGCASWAWFSRSSSTRRSNAATEPRSSATGHQHANPITVPQIAVNNPNGTMKYKASITLAPGFWHRQSSSSSLDSAAPAANWALQSGGQSLCLNHTRRAVVQSTPAGSHAQPSDMPYCGTTEFDLTAVSFPESMLRVRNRA